jgi:hypothetical protein
MHKLVRAFEVALLNLRADAGHEDISPGNDVDQIFAHGGETDFGCESGVVVRDGHLESAVGAGDDWDASQQLAAVFDEQELNGRFRGRYRELAGDVAHAEPRECFFAGFLREHFIAGERLLGDGARM